MLEMILLLVLLFVFLFFFVPSLLFFVGGVREKAHVRRKESLLGAGRRASVDGRRKTSFPLFLDGRGFQRI